MLSGGGKKVNMIQEEFGLSSNDDLNLAGIGCSSKIQTAVVKYYNSDKIINVFWAIK